MYCSHHLLHLPLVYTLLFIVLIVLWLVLVKQEEAACVGIY